MDKILLTGITGFIGDVLADKLIEKYEVHAIVRHKAVENIKQPLLKKKGVVYHTSNLLDQISLDTIVQSVQPNYILHIGAMSPVRFSFTSPLEYQHVNYLSTIYLVHSAIKLKNFKKFIFASTMESYGWQKNTPFKEDQVLHPASPYAVSKVASEKYIEMAGKAYNLPYIIMKPCNTYGRRGNTDFITEFLIVKMLNEEPPSIGTPNAVRDLMYVDDHVSAYLSVLESNVVNETLNFGWGSEMTMLELAKIIASKLNYQGEIKTGFPEDYPDRPVTEEYLSLNSTKAKELVGWQPKINLDQGLDLTIQYWKSKMSI